MTTNENSGGGTGAPEGQGGWQPLPQGGEYDGESTAFVHLPPEDTFDAPLAAPGHGYVPPQIVPPAQADPSAADAQGGVHWPDPQQGGGAQDHAPYAQGGYVQGGYAQGGYDHGGYGPGGGYEPQGTGQWNFSDTGTGAGTGTSDGSDAGAVAGGSELTGQWTIPIAQGDLPDESGEFSKSVLASQWNGGAPPATLPGGAAAPWATEPAPPGADAGVFAAPESVEAPAVPDAPAPVEPEPSAVLPDAVPDLAHEPGPGTLPEAAPETVPEIQAELPVEMPAEPEHAAEPVAETAPESAPESVTAPETDPEPEPAPLTSSNDSAEHPSGSYVLRVNGADRPVTDAWIGESLLYVLRERLGLAGAKDGCSEGECGACNVQVDGRLVASCLVPAATAAGSEVRTVEGLAADGEPSDVQRALAKCGAVQCGFCVPGMAMTVHDLLEGNHAPSELETRQALCGNLCRCSGYRGVLDAVSEVVAGRRASAEAAAAASEEARIPHQAPPGAGGVQPPQANPHADPHTNSHPHSPDGGMA
ncbi:2Fe-2S iron-sulfur cluster-binding protein [Streptomyces scopuliridis]|uniref:2Fe-2S iron-sulfur cluster-binding protein n=1 Tax=Streptomyces scopuliridis TaxID=452529 RepID=UPI0036B12120